MHFALELNLLLVPIGPRLRLTSLRVRLPGSRVGLLPTRAPIPNHLQDAAEPQGGARMANTVDCHACAEQMMQPPERRKPLPKNERPTMVPYTFDEWLCPTGHFRDCTYNERRWFE